MSAGISLLIDETGIRQDYRMNCLRSSKLEKSKCQKELGLISKQQVHSARSVMFIEPIGDMMTQLRGADMF